MYLSRDSCRACSWFEECSVAYSNFLKCGQWAPDGALWIEFEVEDGDEAYPS